MSSAGSIPPDHRRLLGLVHELARREGRQVGPVATTAGPRCFTVAQVASRDEPAWWLLLHQVVAVMAITDVDPGRELVVGHRIIDWPALPAERAAEVGWTVLDRARALEPPGDADLRNLPDHEIVQIRYWRPTTIGEILFNHWD